tara:strand:+ start:289 stop:483 length:195 start_codon:yes stop_codon:yes gene_type:complete
VGGGTKLMHLKIDNGIRTGQNYLRKMVTGGGYYQQKEVKKMKNKFKMKNIFLDGNKKSWELFET